MLADFDPQPFVGWARNMAAIIKDGGTWAVPMNQTAYRFDHKAKKLVLVYGPEDDLFNKTRAVFGELGYDVIADPERPLGGECPATVFSI